MPSTTSLRSSSWTHSEGKLTAKSGPFIFEAILEQGGFVFFSSYDLGVTWSIIKFEELPIKLQEELLQAIKS